MNVTTRDMGNEIMTQFLFPRWEQNIPTLGTKHSHAGNKTGFRLVLDEITSHPQRDYGSLVTRLRLVVTLFLVMVLGVSGVNADDYSGVYYIANLGQNDATNGNVVYSSSSTTTNF